MTDLLLVGGWQGRLVCMWRWSLLLRSKVWTRQSHGLQENLFFFILLLCEVQTLETFGLDISWVLPTPNCITCGLACNPGTEAWCREKTGKWGRNGRKTRETPTAVLKWKTISHWSSELISSLVPILIFQCNFYITTEKYKGKLHQGLISFFYKRSGRKYLRLSGPRGKIKHNI